MDLTLTPILPRDLVTISTLSSGSIGSQSIASAPTSGTFPAANRAIYVPFRNTRQVTIRQLFSYNGAAAADNIDVGIYTENGRRLVSSGAVAQAGTNALQLYDVTDFVLGPGLFYFAVSMSGTTGTLFRIGPSVSLTRIIGLVQEAAAHPLPATATFATVGSGYVPVLGFTAEASL